MKRWLRVTAGALLWIWRAHGMPGDDCRTLQRHGKLTESRSCFRGLLRDHDAFARAEGYLGLGQYDEANSEFRTAEKAQPQAAQVKAEWGRLFLEHYQPGDAAKLFEEAIEADKNYAPAYLGLAKVAGQGFDKKALEFARQALEHDPKLFQAHEYLAYLALEDNDPKAAAEEAERALAISGEALDGMAVLASIDWLNDEEKTEWPQRIAKVNPVYGEAYATGGHFFEINRRYVEAIEWYRKALALNDKLWPARAQLGVNLMRLGQSGEAKQQLERCYAAHFRDAETVNSLRLLDTLPDYVSFKTASTELLLQKKEAALLRPFIEPEFERAIATYERKYKMKLPGAVRLDVFPNHDDLVVRALGLPGVGGLLGVTFGMVVAMDSPSARPAGEFNWASTMWHELSHVYVLTATKHLVPRWFTEGLAVHEEGAASPDWADRMTPEIVTALKKKQLLPVLELDRGFVRPQYPTQVIVSYFEAGQMMDYVAQRWGDAAILGMIHSYAVRKTAADVIQENLHESAESFDKDFTSWLDQRTGDTVRHFDDWKKGMQALHADVKAGKQDEVIKQAAVLRDYYPQYIGTGSAYELIFDAYTAKNDKTAARKEAERYRDMGGKDPDFLKKLARMEQETGDVKQTIATLRKLDFIYPEDEDSHRKLCTLLLDRSDAPGAVQECGAVVALNPGDTAESQYQLARAFQAANRPNDAKDHVVQALEAAPSFKPAQQLLLQLSH